LPFSRGVPWCAVELKNDLTRSSETYQTDNCHRHIEERGYCDGAVGRLLWPGYEEAYVPGELIRRVGVFQASTG
jgi:hypothetical protein